MVPTSCGNWHDLLLHVWNDRAQEDTASDYLRIHNILHRGDQASTDHSSRVFLRLFDVPRHRDDLLVANEGYSQCQFHQEVPRDEEIGVQAQIVSQFGIKRVDFISCTTG